MTLEDRLSRSPDSYQYASVLASIAVSIDDLADDEQRHRYRELAIFTGRGPVSPSSIAALWTSAGLTRGDTDLLLTRFVDRSLVQRDRGGWIKLHDLQYEVAAHQLSAHPDSFAAVHSCLIEGYRCWAIDRTDIGRPEGVGQGTAWQAMRDDGYCLRNLAHHLARAGHGDELDRLLLEFAWLDRRLHSAGISDLLADYTHQPRPPEVDTIHGALQLSAHVLAKDPQLLPGQLIGRLFVQPAPAIQALLSAARGWNGRPWLCPHTPGALIEPGGALERTLQGHTGGVWAVAVAPDGSASSPPAATAGAGVELGGRQGTRLLRTDWRHGSRATPNSRRAGSDAALLSH